MNISGYIKQSLIDYPGHIASVVFTQGCNFHCPYCHNSQLIPVAPGSISLSGILDHISKNQRLLDAVVISGGEPTLQSGLIDFIMKVKQYGLKVKVDTNGSNPAILSKLFQSGLVDYIAMDIKSEIETTAYSKACGKTLTGNLTDRIVQSVGLIIGSGIDHEFRTTVCRELLTPGNIIAIVNSIKGAKRYFIQQYRSDGQQDLFSTYPEEALMKLAEEISAEFPVILRK